MRKFEIKIQNLPTNLPTTIIISQGMNDYSAVKLFKTRVHGKPTVIPGKGWYVYYYFRNPNTGKMQKFMDTCRINRFKTVKERTEAGTSWVKAFEKLLDSGFNPFIDKGLEEKSFEVKVYNVKTGLEYAFNNKIGTWKTATADDYKVRLNVFMEWVYLNKLETIDIREISDVHIIAFLNWIVSPVGRNIGKTSQDNYKRCISGLFGKLVKDKIISTNPCLNLETKKDDPIKNTPFTGFQILEIKNYLLANDLKLYHFILHVVYTFLRPREIVRLKAADIRLKEKVLYVETKTKRKEVKRLIDPLIDFYTSIEVSKIPGKANIFTDDATCKIWDAKEKTKVDHYGLRFKKVKTHFNYGSEYGIYSFRHTAALDLYKRFTTDGSTHREAVLKLMPIIGHENEKTTEKYLRDVGAMLPKDYGEFYSLGF
jgi:integrase